MESLSKSQLEAIVRVAFRDLPPELRAAGGRARRVSREVGTEARRSFGIAERDAQYRRVLSQYQSAVEAAGAAYDARVPRPELARLRPSGGGGTGRLSCIQRAEARSWPEPGRRPVSAGAPGLGKRR